MATKAPAKTNRSTKTTTRTRKTKTTSTAKPKATKQTKVQEYCYSFPCVRGIQSGREYYTAMIPLRLVAKLFRLDTYDDMPPEQRAQRKPSITRVNRLTNYVLNSDYVLSAVTVTLAGKSHPDFEASESNEDIGVLKVSMDGELLIADGQHRVYGLIQALKDKSELGDETLSVVMFHDIGLKRRQQIFYDLNYNTAKPSKSLNLLYDHEQDESKVAKALKDKVKLFKLYTDCERTSLNSRSANAFTFNAISEAVNSYLNGNADIKKLPAEDKSKRAIAWFNAVQAEIPEWQFLLEKKVAPGELREKSLSCHAIALCALGCVGAHLMEKYPESWAEELKKLKLQEFDWSRTNPVFENLIIFGGRITKNRSTCIALGQILLAQKA